MSFKKLLWAILAVSLSFSFVSCDDDEDETYATFAGDLNFTLPKYVQAGDEFTLVPQGLRVYDDDVTYGYYWKVSPTQETLDTTKTEADPRTVLGEFHYQIPDTLCTLKFSVTVFGTGYYTTTVSNSAVILDKDKSLTEQDFNNADGIFTDPRDGREYHYASLGGLDWFCENLSYDACGISLENCSITGEVFGRYYNWEEAEQACPEGWRIPTEADWVKLAQYFSPNGSFSELNTFSGITGHIISNAILNAEDESLWEYWPAVNVTNEKSLNVLPFGFCISEDGFYNFDAFGDRATFWTATPYGDSQAVYRYVYEGKPDVFVAVADRETFFSTVRCVRDSQ